MVYSTTLYRKQGNRVKNKQGTLVLTRLARTHEFKVTTLWNQQVKSDRIVPHN